MSCTSFLAAIAVGAAAASSLLVTDAEARFSR